MTSYKNVWNQTVQERLLYVWNQMMSNNLIVWLLANAIYQNIAMTKRRKQEINFRQSAYKSTYGRIKTVR